MPKTSFTREPTICGVCMRQATGIGYSPKMGAPIAWLCDNPKCIPLGKVVHHMPTSKLSHFEAYSLADAGDKAGEYLEQIGKTDLGELNREEWLKFLNTILTSYSESMRERLLAHDAPF